MVQMNHYYGADKPFAMPPPIADNGSGTTSCPFFEPEGEDMAQPVHPLFDIEITDPAVEAVLMLLSASEETAIRIRTEIEALAGETRQILEANLALMVTPASSQEAVDAAVALARRWRL